MICKTLKELTTIAMRNAIKMHRQGYTYQQPRVGGMQGVYSVDKHDGSVPYAVVAFGTNPACQCPFFEENHPHFPVGKCTCKHIEFVRAEEEDRLRIEAMERDAEERDDAENMIAASERGHGSQWFIPLAEHLAGIQTATLATLKGQYTA